MSDIDWDYIEWPFQLRVRAKTKDELIEHVTVLLNSVRNNEADIVVGFDRGHVLRLKSLSTETGDENKYCVNCYRDIACKQCTLKKTGEPND